MGVSLESSSNKSLTFTYPYEFWMTSPAVVLKNNSCLTLDIFVTCHITISLRYMFNGSSIEEPRFKTIAGSAAWNHISLDALFMDAALLEFRFYAYTNRTGPTVAFRNIKLLDQEC